MSFGLNHHSEIIIIGGYNQTDWLSIHGSTCIADYKNDGFYLPTSNWGSSWCGSTFAVVHWIQTQRAALTRGSKDDVPKCASTPTPFAILRLMLDQFYIPGVSTRTLAGWIPAFFGDYPCDCSSLSQLLVLKSACDRFKVSCAFSIVHGSYHNVQSNSACFLVNPLLLALNVFSCSVCPLEIKHGHATSSICRKATYNNYQTRV